jgi:quercetin dioxygenase-like cupin family protein
MSFIDLDKINKKEIAPGFEGKFIHTDNMTVIYWNIQAGSQLPEHSHHNEQIMTIIEGEFVLTSEGETRNIKPGDVAIFPSNVKHSGKALTDCYIMDVFYPVREDYK